jgi:hypothetical protein
MIASAFGISPDRAERGMRSLAAGLSKADPRFGLGAFSQSAGAAMQGGQKYADDTFANDRKQSNSERDFGLKAQGQQNQDDYHRGMLGVAKQRLEQGNFQPATGKDEEGNDTPGVFDTRTGKFMAGVDVSMRGKGGAGSSGQTERMVKSLTDQGYSLEEAIGIVKRGGGSEADRIRSERLALDAAKNDPAYQKDPQGTIEKYRKQYTKPTNSRYDVDQSLQNAKAAIEKAVRSGNKEAVGRIIQKLERAGIDTKELQSDIERAKSGSTHAFD